MNTKPKIFVFKMREIVYTLLLVLLAALLLLCLVLMFSGQTPESQQTQTQSAPAQNESTDTPSDTPASYVPGVYTSPITLGTSCVDVEVTVDSDRIRAIRLVNLSDSAAAAYPLVSPSLDHITTQILETQTLEGITCPQENRYTSQVLLSAISDALTLASDTDS